ncbi:hypothetical protein FLGE108171_15730 [Flavobacterium gelidilacus]|uniref:hypothetical protein n=1 Tax=Flavobacterium gelidilacus TaxID=206041 RepID=UPI000416B569|nr:hypothetical protein [Flavobacterium gelidilacus]
MKNIVLLIIFFSFLACRNEVKTSKNISNDEQISKLKANKSENAILSNDIEFINDSILKGKFKLDISKYELENSKKECFPGTLKTEEFYEYSLDADRTTKKEFKFLGDINADGKAESVFILPALGWCEEGQSYYFTDNKIPRIQTESNCCHVESIFSIGDIDEDGGIEIAEYSSSCASSFKSINIWTLKNSKWKLVADFSFKINNEYKAFDDFDKLYKKVSKGKFKFLEIYDINGKGELLKEWKTITME